MDTAKDSVKLIRVYLDPKKHNFNKKNYLNLLYFVIDCKAFAVVHEKHWFAGRGHFSFEDFA